MTLTVARASGVKIARSIHFLKDLYCEPEPEGWDEVTDDLKRVFLESITLADPRGNAGPLNGKASWRVLSSDARDDMLHDASRA